MTKVMLKQLERYCNTLQLMFRRSQDDKETLVAALETRLGLFHLSLAVSDDGSFVLARVRRAYQVPKARRAEVGILVADLNYRGVGFGRLAMDMSDGEVTFEAGLPTQAGLALSTFRQALQLMVGELEQCIPAIAIFTASSDSFEEVLRPPTGIESTEELHQALDG